MVRTHQHLARGIWKNSLVAAAFATALACSSMAGAQTTTVTTTNDPLGGAVFSTGVLTTGGNAEGNRRVGNSATSGVGISSIYFFELPALGPKQILTAADFDFNYFEQDGTPSFSADLYGLGFVTAPPALDADWYFDGASDTQTRASLGTGTSGTVDLIEDDILVTDVTPEGIRIATAETDNLLDFVQSLYDDGAQGGDFAVLRLNADAAPLGTEAGFGFDVTHTDGTATTVNDLAELTLTIQQVPEPASIALWCLLGALATLLAYRRATPRRTGTNSDWPV